MTRASTKDPVRSRLALLLKSPFKLGVRLSSTSQLQLCSVSTDPTGSSLSLKFTPFVPAAFCSNAYLS